MRDSQMNPDATSMRFQPRIIQATHPTVMEPLGGGGGGSCGSGGGGQPPLVTHAESPVETLATPVRILHIPRAPQGDELAFSCGSCGGGGGGGCRGFAPTMAGERQMSQDVTSGVWA